MAQATYDIVSIQNIDDEDFTFEYDRSAGNYPHTIAAGEVKRFPRFLAQHAVKHLIDKILNKKNERTNNEVMRIALAEQIVVDEEILQKPPVKTDAEELKEEVDRLNVPSELETVLKRNRGKEKINTTPPIQETPSSVPEEKFAGLEPAVDTTDNDVPEVKPEVKAIPTRKEIIDYGKNKMGMTFDEKQMKSLNKMKVSELLTEIGDPRLDLSNG